MFGGAHGYASNALFIALMRKLVSKGILTQDEAFDVLDDAATTLGPFGHVISIGAAIRIIQTDAKGQIAA
jgi:hypothetical protein